MSVKHNCKVICILGGPGSGKTTHASRLSSKIPNSVSLKSGTIIKTAINSGSVANGESVSFLIERGGLVNDDLANEIVLNKIKQVASDPNNHLIILDGYPRTVGQFKALKDLNEIEIAGIIKLDAPENILEKRCKIRNLKTDRVDDLYDSVLERIQDYQSHIQEIIGCVDGDNIKSININTSGNLEETAASSVDFAINLHL